MDDGLTNVRTGSTHGVHPIVSSIGVNCLIGKRNSPM